VSFDVRTVPHFEREAKALAKRYRSFKDDLKDFIDSLGENPMQGTELSPGIRKIRLVVTSKGIGKSGGARVITYTICTSESSGRVYLVDIYDKADYSTVDVSVIKKMIAKLDIL
jgi:mRNA-degrading endonuclease RelE of RelBE toxin-antitoxin system